MRGFATDLALRIVESMEEDAPVELIAALVHAEAAQTIASAIRLVSEGTERGPAGLEGLAMSIAGDGLHGNLCDSLGQVADAIRELKHDDD